MAFRDFPIHFSIYTQAVAYTMYVELAARRALKNTLKKMTFELGKPVIIISIFNLSWDWSELPGKQQTNY